MDKNLDMCNSFVWARACRHVFDWLWVRARSFRYRNELSTMIVFEDSDTLTNVRNSIYHRQVSYWNSNRIHCQRETISTPGLARFKLHGSGVTLELSIQHGFSFVTHMPIFTIYSALFQQHGCIWCLTGSLVQFQNTFFICTRAYSKNSIGLNFQKYFYKPL